MTRSSGQGGRYSLAELVARAAFPLMALASAGAFWLATPRAQDDYIRWLLFLTVYLILACLPTWLYTRFLSVKLTSIYVEYVLNLHRLGVDRPEFLPEPPYTSEYHETWANATKRHHTRHPRDAESAEPIPGMTVYDAKFDAYYGDRRDDKQGVTRFCGLGSLLPVVVCWLAFATGWLTIFTEPGFISGDLGSVDLADALRFAFLGVYVFSVQLTVRAFFQNDLRSGTYVAIMERLGVALILVSVAHVVWAALPSLAGMEPVIAFVIGTFPWSATDGSPGSPRTGWASGCRYTWRHVTGTSRQKVSSDDSCGGKQSPVVRGAAADASTDDAGVPGVPGPGRPDGRLR